MKANLLLVGTLVLGVSVFISGRAPAAVYDNVTTGFYDYVVNDVTDTWSGSDITVTNDQSVASGADSSGTLALSNTTMTVGNQWRLAADGANATANVTLTDSSVTAPTAGVGGLYAGSGSAGVATLTMTRSTNVINRYLSAAANGSFTLNMTDSRIAATYYLAVMNLGNATVTMTNSSIRWARDQGGDQRTYQSSFIGINTGPVTLNVRAGSSFIVENNHNAGDRLSFGYNENATANVEDSEFRWRKLVMGDQAGATGRIEAVRSAITAIASAKWEYIGDSGTGVILLNSSTGSFQTVSFGRGATGQGTLIANASSVSADGAYTFVGYAGAGQVTLTNRSSLTLGSGNSLHIGYEGGASGLLTLGNSTGTVNNAYVAFNSGSTGTVHLLPGSKLDVTNDFDMSTNGTPRLQLTLAGTSAGQFGRITVGGGVQLAGALEVLLDGYTPSVGDKWSILTGASAVDGTFDDVTSGYQVNYLSDGFEVEVIPEPGTLVLLVTAGLALWGYRRRR
ncbi:MAG: PEP-CTERM sorting domain-containing protein [Candidatus Marinimicrobia bacterium]|nr:PEP-CTERM sorting domain-containing protein [Candidatus Neomarinimicrobiota bacterium]